MKKFKFKQFGTMLGIMVFCALSLILSDFGQGVSPANAEKLHIRLGTSKEGTAAYASGVGLSASVKKRIDNISMEAVPTPGSTASVKIFAKNGLDMAYASTWTLKDAYKNTGPFAKKPINRKPLQGLYWLTADWFVVVKADRNDINSLSDLKGKKFFPMIAGSGIYDVYRYVFSELGIWKKIKTRQIGSMEAADALQMGTLDALGAYSTNRGQNTVSWMRNVDSRLKIKVVGPSPEEKNAIEKINGVSCGDLTKKWMRPANQKNNPGKLWGWSVHYGFHPGKDMPTEAFYKVYKNWIENCTADLAPVNAILKSFSVDPISVQLRGIQEAKDIPVHPGAAKYLKEKGLWQENWIVGTLNSGVK